MHVRFLTPQERRLAVVVCSFCKQERRKRAELMQAVGDGTHTICIYCAKDAVHEFLVAKGDE